MYLLVFFFNLLCFIIIYALFHCDTVQVHKSNPARKDSDELDLASAPHRCCSWSHLCCGCPAVLNIWGPPFSKVFGRWRPNVISQVYSMFLLSASLPQFLSFSDGARLYFITHLLIFQRHSNTFITRFDLIKNHLPHLFLTH